MLEKQLTSLLPRGHRERICLLDSNLLLLWITAQVDSRLVTSMKRVKSFTGADTLLLLWLIDQFRSVATTAYTLTEVSNLANELHGRTRNVWFMALQEYAKATEERHVPLKTLGAHPLFASYGVADAALAELSKDAVLITAEYRLSGRLASDGLEVLNFNHFRQRAW